MEGVRRDPDRHAPGDVDAIDRDAFGGCPSGAVAGDRVVDTHCFVDEGVEEGDFGEVLVGEFVWDGFAVGLLKLDVEEVLVVGVVGELVEQVGEDGADGITAMMEISHREYLLRKKDLRRSGQDQSRVRVQDDFVGKGNWLFGSHVVQEVLQDVALVVVFRLFFGLVSALFIFRPTVSQS